MVAKHLTDYHMRTDRFAKTIVFCVDQEHAEEMRKDKGLNGDLDRLPMLTWIMFLKFLDDMERIRETEEELAGRKYKPAIEPPYRWRDWAAIGISGDIGLGISVRVLGSTTRSNISKLLFAYLTFTSRIFFNTSSFTTF